MKTTSVYYIFGVCTAASSCGYCLCISDYYDYYCE